MEGKLDCLDRFTTELDHCKLDNDCGNQNDQKQWVVEEMLEYVGFSDLQLSSVDLIEDL